MENKRKNVYITIFVITTVLASCLAVYFGIKGNRDVEKLEAKLNENTSLTDDITKEQEIKNDEKTATDNPKVVEKVVEKYILPEFNSSKCINKEDGHKYSLQVGDSMSDLSCNLNEDKKSVTLRFTADMIKLYYNIDIKSSNESINISNFSTEVIGISIHGLSTQTVGYEVILFLMKDGTIEYLPLYNAVKNNNFKSYGKLDGVSDIVRVENGLDETGNRKFGIPIAIKSDGSFYNLYNIIYKTGTLNF